jgi:hypothetical protein
MKVAFAKYHLQGSCTFFATQIKDFSKTFQDRFGNFQRLFSIKTALLLAVGVPVAFSIRGEVENVGIYLINFGFAS